MGNCTTKLLEKLSHEKAIEKAEKEYRRYQVKTLSSVEKDYLEVIKATEKKIVKKVKANKKYAK